VLFSVLLLGDVLDWRMIVGGLLTLSGITVIRARTQGRGNGHLSRSSSRLAGH
jgi:drug/metabolite transporter (DMT)-like permease